MKGAISEMEIPRIVILDLYRNSLSTVEKLSRAQRDKKVHAWAVKARKEVGDLIMQCAYDEMEDINEEDNDPKKEISEEEFYG